MHNMEKEKPKICVGPYSHNDPVLYEFQLPNTYFDEYLRNCWMWPLVLCVRDLLGHTLMPIFVLRSQSDQSCLPGICLCLVFQCKI